jgi:peptidoglycan pentaglycine glycine transferase (the first glycine)
VRLEKMSITIQEINDREQWNNFLLRQPHGHFLQSYEWGDLSQELGEHIYRLGVLDDGRLIGTMLLIVSSVSLPLPKLRPTWLYCVRGPVLERLDAAILARLLKYIDGIAQREHAIVLRVEPNIADDDPALDIWLATYYKAGFQSNPNSVHGRRSWVLDIRPSKEQLFADFQPVWRQAIQTAERQGVTIYEAYGESDFNTYYALLLQAGEREGVFVHSREYHWHLWSIFAARNDATILLAERAGRVVATKLLLRFGDWCWDMFTGYADEPWPQPLTYLLQYTALQWAQMREARFFDFSSIPDVLVPGEDRWDAYEYKRGFGGFSRLTMPTQDYIYQPLIYKPWRKLIEIGREQRHKERQNIDIERPLLSGIAEVVFDAD